MKKKQVKDAAALPPEAAPVFWRDLSRRIYGALENLYNQHRDIRPHDFEELQDALYWATTDDFDPPPLRKVMKRTPEEECEYAIGMLQCSCPEAVAKRLGGLGIQPRPKKVDEVFDAIWAKRRLNADVQVLIDLVGQALEAAGSRIDWDKRPEFEDDNEEHQGDDTTEFPET